MTGGAFRIIRDDVNSSGQVLEGGITFSRSLGGVDTRPGSGGNYTLTPGCQKSYYNPDAILNVSPMWFPPVKSTSRGRPQGRRAGQDPAGFQAAKHGYIIKYSSANSVDGSCRFRSGGHLRNNSRRVADGFLESRSVMNLLANTQLLPLGQVLRHGLERVEVSQATSATPSANPGDAPRPVLLRENQHPVGVGHQQPKARGLPFVSTPKLFSTPPLWMAWEERPVTGACQGAV